MFLCPRVLVQEITYGCCVYIIKKCPNIKKLSLDVILSAKVPFCKH